MISTLIFAKETILYSAIVANILLITSCDHNQKPEDTKAIAEEHNEAKFHNTHQEQDAQFLVNAAEVHLEVIQLGQLAQQKGRTTHVRELGRMIEDAHTKLLRDLTSLAKSKMITIPSTPTDDIQDTYQDFNEKSENDFDKAYADRMVSGHKDAIEAFENAARDSNDKDIKNWASATLSDLRTHLDHSIECQRKCEEISLKNN